MDVIVSPEKHVHAIMDQSESLNGLYDVSTADVYFLCIDDDTKLVPAHRCILASDSQKFREIFFTKSTQMLMDDCTLDTLTAFLKSFYCEVFEIKRNSLVALTQLAEKYNAIKCRSACWEFVQQMIQTSHEDICLAFDLAITYNKMDLRRQCIAKIMAVGRSLIETASFVSCTRQVFKIIVSLDFCDRDEVKVFMACMNWAKHRCEMENLDANHPSNVRFVLGDTFSHIQFHKMNSSQFVQCLSLHADIFTTDELKTIATSVNGMKPLKCYRNHTKADEQRRFLKTMIIANHHPYEAIAAMFGDDKTSNVFFLFENSDSEQKLIYAHKCVLAAKSDVFKQLFSNETVTDGNYPIFDASYDDFSTFIQTFYRQTTDGLLTMENIAKIIELAHLYEVNGLLENCIDFATKRLAARNIFRILDLCFIYSNADSVSLCLDWIIANENDMNRAFHARSLVDCSRKTVEFTLGLNFPNRNESQVFAATIEWAKKTCHQNQLETTPQNLRQTLGTAFDLIRFSSMLRSLNAHSTTTNFSAMTKSRRSTKKLSQG